MYGSIGGEVKYEDRGEDVSLVSNDVECEDSSMMDRVLVWNIFGGKNLMGWSSCVFIEVLFLMLVLKLIVDEGKEVTTSKLEEYIAGDYGWVNEINAEDKFNEVVDTYQDIEELEDARDQVLEVDSNEPLPLVGPRYGLRVPIDHFFNEDLEYLKIGNKDIKRMKYDLSITKLQLQSTRSGGLKKTLVESSGTYRGKRVVVTNGKYYWIRVDKREYTFKESNLSQLNLNDIEDMYLLKAQGELKHLRGTTEYYLVQSQLVYMRSIIIKKRVEDIQTFRVVYEGKYELKKFMRSYKVFKFCDGTLIYVRDQLENNLRLNKVGKFYKSLNRQWTEREVKRFDTMLKKINVVLKELRRLEIYVGRRPRTG
ncbi:hypothetical protein Tco_0690208 [Tanacetum coccineum]